MFVYFFSFVSMVDFRFDGKERDCRKNDAFVSYGSRFNNMIQNIHISGFYEPAQRRIRIYKISYDVCVYLREILFYNFN